MLREITDVGVNCEQSIVFLFWKNIKTGSSKYLILTVWNNIVLYPVD
jgi:hypothetical protein